MLALGGPNRTSEARFLTVTGERAWRRCAFAGLALVGESIQLAWKDDSPAALPSDAIDPAGAGLVFDDRCRLLHSVPAKGLVERVLWGAFDPLHPARDLAAEPVIGVAPPAPGGDFAPAEPVPPGFTPLALAVDGEGRLFVMDGTANAVRVFDLPARRLIRTIPAPAGAVDIAFWGGRLYGLSAGQIWLTSAGQGLRRTKAVLDGIDAPGRVTFAEDGRCFVLSGLGTAGAAIFELGRAGRWLAAPREVVVGEVGAFAQASDIVCIGEGEDERLVVARRPGETFLRLDISSPTYGLTEPLLARAYDGLGIAAAPDGRVAFWTAKGVRHAVAARARYLDHGRVVSFRLDAGEYRTVWGRVLLDACIPRGTTVRVLSVVSDDDDAPFMEMADRLERIPPAFSALAPVAEEATTPLPPLVLAPQEDERGPIVVRRSDGSEQPWANAEEGFATYEAQPPSARGRYLWLVLDLDGTSLATPRVRDVRVEKPGHDWMRRLPALYGREEKTRAFLQSYLAPAAGLQEDTAALSQTRSALLKPMSAPTSVLPWLAGWLGLTLDERWSETARRTMIAEAPALLRARGTLWALRRMVEIVAEAPAVILEDFRLRGLGQSAAAQDGWSSASVVGSGLRVGGPVGQSQATVTTSPADLASVFAAHAHRFSILIQAELEPERMAAIRDLLEAHRPAHTLVDVCTGEAGMRVGRGLHVGFSAIIGKGARWEQLQTGVSRLARDGLVGRPTPGLRAGEGRLGSSSLRIG